MNRNRVAACVGIRTQYINGETNYDRYRQLPKQKKALFIDDFNACHLPKEKRTKLIENFGDIFGFVFFTIDAAYGLLPECQTSFKNLDFYSIKPFGYVKRNSLIERYIKYRHSDIIDNDEFFDKVKHTFDKLNHVIGDKLIPPYPVLLLTVIQALDYAPIDLNETSYGYCYQTLIHLALNDVGVAREDIDAYVNFITELAFEIFEKESKSISETEFEAFYFKYSKKFWAPDFKTLSENLLNAEILKKELGEYQFGYIYIFYFLAAKKIADLIDKENGKKIVRLLFENLHVERYANILVFVTHHTKNETFIEESILIAMSHFDRIDPITLEKNCRYYNLLEEIVKEITTDVIEMRDPIQERNHRLIADDKQDIEKKTEAPDESATENDLHLRPFLHAFRSIEILGQIVKNRKGSLETAKLKMMITELYSAAFRMINYLGEQIRRGENELAQKVKEKVKDKDLRYDVERKVYRVLHFMSLQACLGTFSKLIQHVGVRELHALFNEVANDIDTPAAHLVSFSINSYYDKINMKELEKLSKDFEGNYVAFQILRARVKSYLYNNHVSYKSKQQIGACLKMQVPARIGQKDKGV